MWQNWAPTHDKTLQKKWNRHLGGDGETSKPLFFTASECTWSSVLIFGHLGPFELTAFLISPYFLHICSYPRTNFHLQQLTVTRSISPFWHAGKIQDHVYDRRNCPMHVCSFQFGCGLGVVSWHNLTAGNTLTCQVPPKLIYRQGK